MKQGGRNIKVKKIGSTLTVQPNRAWEGLPRRMSERFPNSSVQSLKHDTQEDWRL